MQDHFFRQLMRGTLPLLVWATHFTFCYLLAAAQCTPAVMRTGGPDRLLLGIATVLLLLGYVSVALLFPRRCLHDRLAGTVLVPL